MSENEEMTEQEFIEFVKRNGDRIREILEEPCERTEDCFKESAKRTKDRVKENIEKVDDKITGLFDALLSPTVQKHVIGAGIEIAMGISAFFTALPKSERVQEFYDRAEEARRAASATVCAKNPDCIRKDAGKREELRKIEID